MLAYNNFSYIYIYIYIGQPLHNQTQLGSTTKPLTLYTELTRKKKRTTQLPKLPQPQGL